MKLKQLIVKKLFGVFDHSVSVNNNEGITIVIGENGLGKTVLLEMIESFFKSRFFYFAKVTFSSVIFIFDYGIKWTLIKRENTDTIQ